jgi:hypothetical protein
MPTVDAYGMSYDFDLGAEDDRRAQMDAARYAVRGRAPGTDACVAAGCGAARALQVGYGERPVSEPVMDIVAPLGKLGAAQMRWTQATTRHTQRPGLDAEA